MSNIKKLTGMQIWSDIEYGNRLKSGDEEFVKYDDIKELLEKDSSKRQVDAGVMGSEGTDSDRREGIRYELNHLVDVWKKMSKNLVKNGCCESAMAGDSNEYTEYWRLEACVDDLVEILQRFNWRSEP